MLTYTLDEDAGVVDLIVDGEIARQDYQDLIPVLEKLIERHGKLRAVETVRKIGPVDMSLWWQDLKWVFEHRNDLARCAVITDHGWIGPVTKAFGALFPAEIRTFTEAEGGKARAWVREG
jgi:hypothetical protein